jgi:hypothetical protein
MYLTRIFKFMINLQIYKQYDSLEFDMARNADRSETLDFSRVCVSNIYILRN